MAFTLKKASYLFFIISLLFIITISCDTNGINEKQFRTEYYKETQLSNIYDNEISKLNEQLIEATIRLNVITEEFAQQPTLVNLISIRNEWTEMVLVWKQLELYRVGPISSSYIYYRINYWPTNITFINNFIDGTDVINESYIESKGGSAKGISALEYLLFNTDAETTLNSFTTDFNFERRLDYLVSLSQNLITKTQELEALWIAYNPEFISATEVGLDGSQNLVINEMVALLEEIKIYKLGKALGDTNGGAIDINELEAYRSQKSLEIIKANLKSLERSFNGDFAQTPFRIGFDDYLIQLGYESLAIEINNNFINCYTKIDAINNPLIIEVVNSTQNVTDLQTAVTELLVLIKVDMANAIGSTITFNDNDGD
ncbi:imelysin family protein [Winogradskyella sp.]|uniref:imelysin family protein n=1 Tax=Winogradskyella sp. TaxID=1883156 RepID=UPI0025CF446D|nr:imelysin family protein [Winogradskyella sp.]